MKLRRHCVQIGFQLSPSSPVELLTKPRCFFSRRSALLWMSGMRQYLPQPHFSLWIDKA